MINFNLTFVTNKKGFTPSKEQQDAMNLAATTWGQIFDHDATIELRVESVNNPNSDTLMSAADSVPTDIMEGFDGSAVVRTKVLTGVDTNGSESDGVVEVNWGTNWELDINETPDTSVAGQEEFDFYSTFYHEIAHTMGFLSSIQEDGSDADGFGIETPGAWTFFDQFISDSQGDPVIDPKTFRTDTELYIPLSTGGSSADEMSGLFFNGPNAVAANSNKPVGLFSPAKFDISSSLSHLDDDNPAFEGFLTLAAVDSGPAARTLAPVEKAIFEDLGYQFVSSETIDMTATNDEDQGQLRQGTEDDDVLMGGNGNDTLGGKEGNDDLNGAAGDDILFGVNGNDTLTGGDGNDLLRGQSGNDVINGNAGNDTLLGGNQFDRLNGGDGDDLLDGVNGITILNGGTGSDLFIVNNDVLALTDYIQDFEVGVDRVGLIDGVTFEQLEITGGVNSFISLQGAEIGVLLGVDPEELTADSFQEV